MFVPGPAGSPMRGLRGALARPATPAFGPSITATRAPLSGAPAVFDTVPWIPAVVGAGAGAGAGAGGGAGARAGARAGGRDLRRLSAPHSVRPGMQRDLAARN